MRNERIWNRTAEPVGRVPVLTEGVRPSSGGHVDPHEHFNPAAAGPVNREKHICLPVNQRLGSFVSGEVIVGSDGRMCLISAVVPSML
jgi:hypothetical protein